MTKNILRYLIFVFVSILIVGVGTYITSLHSPNMVCYSIEVPGVIKDGNSLIPMARFDRLKMIAEIGKDKKINAPYYILCERTIQNGAVYRCLSNRQLVFCNPYKVRILSQFHTLYYSQNFFFSFSMLDFFSKSFHNLIISGRNQFGTRRLGTQSNKASEKV